MPQIRTLPAHSTPPWPLPHLPCIAHARLARTSVSFGVAGGAALFGVDGSAAAVASVAGAAIESAGTSTWCGAGLGLGFGLGIGYGVWLGGWVVSVDG